MLTLIWLIPVQPRVGMVQAQKKAISPLSGNYFLGYSAISLPCSRIAGKIYKQLLQALPSGFYSGDFKTMV